MTHYPAVLAEEDVRGRGLRASGSEPGAGEAGRARKARARWWVRRLGMAAACVQLGTAFAATRALFTAEARQRLVDMDLRWPLELQETTHHVTQHRRLIHLPLTHAHLRLMTDVECASDVGV